MKKPFTATTVLVERLTSEEYEENDYSGLPELIESIKLQDSGPTEASRAIRKKLKYGNVHRQLRALTLLDALISNAGSRFQRSFADEPLLERLRVAATAATTDPDVQAKLKVLFAQWAREYQGTQGLQGIVNLHTQIPRRARTAQTKPATLAKPMSLPPSPTQARPWASKQATHKKTASSGKKNKQQQQEQQQQQPAFDLEKEKPALSQALANASVASTNLINALKLINREKERPSQKLEVVQHYESCKALRNSILRYIQHVESEEWLGSLIHTHEELATALETYESYDKPIEEDSDSEDEWSSPGADDGGVAAHMGGLKVGDEDEAPPAMPPRPKGKVPAEEEDDDDHPDEDDDPDDPFGNQHEVPDTPGPEDDRRPGMRWKVV